MNGIVLFNNGTKYLSRMAVLLYSLRKHNPDVPVIIFTEDDFGEILLKLCTRFNATPVQFKCEGVNNYTKKTWIAKQCAFDCTLFIDSDCLVLDSVDYLFEKAEKYGLVYTNFSNWKPTGRMVGKRIRHYEKSYPELVEKALRYPTAINTGVFCICSNQTEYLDDWYETCVRGFHEKVPYTDEIAAQILIPQYKHFLAGTEWNFSVLYGEQAVPLGEAKIIHYHGNKQCKDNEACELWKEHFHEIKDELKLEAWGDRRLKNYIKSLPEGGCQKSPVDDRITYVSLVDKAYFEKFKKNYQTWVKYLNMENQKFVIMYEGLDEFDLDFVKNAKKVRVIVNPEKGRRGEMISKFITEAHKHVDTEFWIKIDADCSAERAIIWEDELLKYDVLGHRWGYTKIKGDEWEEGDEHWLNKLDRFVLPDNENLFPKITGKRHPHKRFASYICLHKTEFSKHVASLVEEWGEIPVPSHDTLLWFVAEKDPDRSWKKINMKSKGLRV